MNATRRTAALALGALMLTILACQLTSGDGNGDDNIVVPSGPEILFQDDFSDPSSGWDRVSEDRGVADYTNGAYRISVNVENSDHWANPGQAFIDIRVEVDATKVGGPDDNDFGVICRYLGKEQFYAFLISSDGFAGIAKVTSDGMSFLGEQNMQPASEIIEGASTNKIRADCIGSTLTLYVNGQEVMEAEDAEYSSGDIGLIAGTFAEPGTDILFDNFVVYKQ